MTLEELRDAHLKSLAVAIQQGLSPLDCYQALEVIFDQALRAAEQRGIERAKQACREQIKIFGSSKYAVNQPMSSMGERFGCGQCIDAIDALADKPMEAK